MSDYDFTFDLSMKYTQADFDAITDEEFEKTTEVFLYNRKGKEFHFIKPKVGKWEECKVVDIEDTTITEVQSAFCPICRKYHTTPYMYYFDYFNYCPNCGAKMEGRKE